VRPRSDTDLRHPAKAPSCAQVAELGEFLVGAAGLEPTTSAV
jgi:hypothetical protein